MQTEAEAKYEKANERKTRPDAQQKTLEDLMSGYAISVNTQCLVVYASDIAHTQTHARVVYSIHILASTGAWRLELVYPHYEQRKQYFVK